MPLSEPLSKLTVWYNTKCPVCNAGIDWQRSRLVRAARAGAIEFRDINFEPEALSRFDAGLEDVRRRLYGVDAEGAAVYRRRLRHRHLAADAGGGLAWALARPASNPVGHAVRLRSLCRWALRLESAEGALVGAGFAGQTTLNRLEAATSGIISATRPRNLVLQPRYGIPRKQLPTATVTVRALAKKARGGGDISAHELVRQTVDQHLDLRLVFLRLAG